MRRFIIKRSAVQSRVASNKTRKRCHAITAPPAPARRVHTLAHTNKKCCGDCKLYKLARSYARQLVCSASAAIIIDYFPGGLTSPSEFKPHRLAWPTLARAQIQWRARMRSTDPPGRASVSRRPGPRLLQRRRAPQQASPEPPCPPLSRRLSSLLSPPPSSPLSAGAPASAR